MKYLQYPLAILVLSFASSCQQEYRVADLIIKNAIIWTGNEHQPRAEAMAISADTILAVGSNVEVMQFVGSNTIISDLNGKFVTPGFIDSHVHIFFGGFNLASVKLRDARTPAEFINRIAAFAKTQKPETWILGGDWDGKEWAGLPEKSWIDSVTSENPVFVFRLDGHMALANSLALKLTTIEKSVENVDGGIIIRDKAGELTGVFKDNAMNLIFNKLPPPSSEAIDNALSVAMNYMASNGVTSVHALWDESDAVGYPEGIERARKNNTLITRFYAMGSLKNWKIISDKVKVQGKGDHWLRIGAVKGFVDGSLGSHTAAFLDPFSDLQTDSGFFLHDEKELYNWISNADKAGLHIAVHAIGDRAVHFLLNTYQQVESENGVKDRRFRIEHAQHIAQGDLERFAKLNVIASMQPYHAIDDGRWAEKIIGPIRIKSTYAFKSLLDNGTIVAFGSDWPVAPATPLEGIYSAVTRRTLDDKNPDGWVPEQKITVEQSLLAYTKYGAFASFEENIKGTLEVGKLADFVILNEDITRINPVNISDTKIMQTYVGGKIVYDSKDN